MADPHSRSISYSALPVFSGDYLAPVAPSELLAPRLSGIPLIAPVRRYVSAGAQSGAQPSAPPGPPNTGMPKSQSFRGLRTASSPRAGHQGAGVTAQGAPQGASSTAASASSSVRRPTALPTSQSHRDLQPRRQGQPSLRLRPKHVSATGATAAGASSGASSGGASQPSGMSRTVSSHHVTKFAHGSVHANAGNAANTSASSISSAASTASTASSTATTTRAIPRSVSLKTIPKKSPPRVKPTTASNVPACATVSTAASAAKQISRSDSTRSKRSSARVVRAPLPTSGSMNSLRMGRGTQGQPAQGNGSGAGASANGNGTSFTSYAALGPTPHPSGTAHGAHAPPAAPHVTTSTTALTTPPKPRRTLPRRPPKLDLSRVKAADAQARPDSSGSSRSSRSSFTEATQRLFGRIRSAASSRSSTRRGTPQESQFPMPPALQTQADEWETCHVAAPPALQIAAELALLAREHDSSAVVEEAAIKQPQQGLALSKSSTLLTRNERLEILNYASVFYAGKPGVQKQTGSFTDDQGNYRSVLNDHIAYRYQIVAELGKGSFGKVFKAKDHKTGRSVALKITCNRAEMRHQARVEARLLQTLRKAGQPDKHHFLRYVSSFTFRDHFCICTEILGDNLYDLLRRNKYKGLGTPLVRYITRQLVEGLEFLDLQGIIHCDLKPENILVSDRDLCQVKIIDFGSGCLEDKRIYTYIQSRFYRAPEILLGIPYTTAIDMWSLGCIVPELLRGKPIFPGEDEVDQIAALCETIGTPDQLTLKSCSRSNMFFDNRGALLSRKKRGPPGSRPLSTLLDPQAADFCAKLLQWSPQKRLSAGGALFHEFVLGV